MPELINTIKSNSEVSSDDKKISMEYLTYLGQHFIEQSSGYIIDVPVEEYNKKMQEYIQTIDRELLGQDLVTMDDMKSAYTEISASDITLDEKFSMNYDRDKKMAEERGLPLKERDISKYRAEHGLEPMTEKAKRGLCNNILKKCCAGDKELEELYDKFSNSFINNHFREFYEKFMRLKENPHFSKEDILRAFSDVARDDIDFAKISRNIDEMYLSTEDKWMNRFNGWYTISEKLKERTNNRQVNTQEQDTNER